MALTRYSPIVVEAALRASTFRPPVPPATDRDAWAAIREAIGPEEEARWIAAAEAVARAPVPPLPATLYLEYKRVGRREGYQEPMRGRRHALARLTAAECLQGRGRFLDAILDLAWAICEESSWAYPAHQTELADPTHPVVDLGAAMTALDLAELDHVLGHALDGALGRRVAHEVDRRCLAPYLERHDHRWMFTTPDHGVNNWAGVCNAGVVGSAVYLERDPARLAELVARAARSLDDYLASLDVDGGSSEGPSIWAYGFSHYTLLADLLERRTGGRVSLFDEPIVRETAQFPLRTLLSPGRYVNFSDALRSGGQLRPHLAYLSRRLDLPDLMRLARASEPGGPSREALAWALRWMVWRTSPEPPGELVPARHDWFRGMTWMISRYDPTDPDALVLAAKGGHNAERHNQNDVGSFTVDVCGEALVCELGRPRFRRGTFGAERYEILANSSLGHSVPIPSGRAQLPGAERAATLLEHRHDARADVLGLELSAAYPAEANIASLQRLLTLHREPPRGWVELVDRVRFRAPTTFATQLVTLARVEVGAGVVRIAGERGRLRVEYAPTSVEVSVVEDRGVELDAGPVDVRRVRFALPGAATEGEIRLRIVPQ